MSEVVVKCKNCGRPIIHKYWGGHEWWSHIGASDFCYPAKAEPPAPPETKKPASRGEKV